MTESLFLLGSDNVLKPMKSAAFDTEDVFQDLLAKFPELLTDADFGEGSPRRWLLVGREAPIPDAEGGPGRWSLDHLFLDQDGVPTLVEVKRASDTRARREVVAQMLDYAANAVSWWRVEELARTFAESCAKQGTTPRTKLGELLGMEAPDPEAFWRSVQSNLGSGRLRLIFVADRIPPELERIVEFLNEQMSPATVVALELRPFASGSERILAPRLVGVTSRAAQQKSVAGPQVSVRSTDDWFSQVLSAPSGVPVRRFVDAMCRLGASCEPAGQSLAVEAGRARTRLAYIRSNGRVALSCYQLAKTAAFKTGASRSSLIENLESRGFAVSSRNPSGEPTFGLPQAGDEHKWAALQQFMDALLRTLTEPSA